MQPRLFEIDPIETPSPTTEFVETKPDIIAMCDELYDIGQPALALELWEAWQREMGDAA